MIQCLSVECATFDKNFERHAAFRLLNYMLSFASFCATSNCYIFFAGCTFVVRVESKISKLNDGNYLATLNRFFPLSKLSTPLV